MTISEIIAVLTALKDQHGDLPVLHENDWTHFLVDRIEFMPARDGNDPLEDCKEPAHVVLFGDSLFYDCKTGDWYRPLRTSGPSVLKINI